jgi:hypothetical protein
MVAALLRITFFIMIITPSFNTFLSLIINFFGYLGRGPVDHRCTLVLFEYDGIRLHHLRLAVDILTPLQCLLLCIVVHHIVKSV